MSKVKSKTTCTDRMNLQAIKTAWHSSRSFLWPMALQLQRSIAIGDQWTILFWFSYESTEIFQIRACRICRACQMKLWNENQSKKFEVSFDKLDIFDRLLFENFHPTKLSKLSFEVKIDKRDETLSWKILIQFVDFVDWSCMQSDTNWKLVDFYDVNEYVQTSAHDPLYLH